MIIYGSHGKIVIPDYWKASSATLYDHTGHATSLQVTQNSEFVFEIQHFNQLWSQHQLTSPVMTPTLACHTVAIVEDLYRQWTTSI